MTTLTTQPLLPDTGLTIYCLKGDLSDVEIDSPGFLGNWLDDGFSFLFFREEDDFSIEQFLAGHSRFTLEDQFTMTYREWQGGYAEPIKIGRFLLSPPWLRRVAADDEIGIVFDPGLVFGNGTHPTTLACLTAVEIACAGGKVRRMIDLGTGTGLLALAAVRLGCDQVIGVDNTMLAASTARNNCTINQLEESLLVVNGDARDFASIPADLLVANIGYPVLDDILTAENLKNHRWLVLSGLQNHEAESILLQLADLDVVVLRHWRSDTIWNTILAITGDGR